ncbi:unnamed protein product [Chondrus crispus]|uniref:Uncharacterized protein n=1 Tax=Chondrus crispus TaxID=2769 RepID=R7QN83_CHOCR|nr:unnamed protein product [Chondrus crispus]CDF38931.1 unnamed protein product [Chondrus crispus]|eukprot:XP_005718836.1 unnamed protein product [Chondrus crispus]
MEKQNRIFKRKRLRSTCLRIRVAQPVQGFDISSSNRTTPQATVVNQGIYINGTRPELIKRRFENLHRRHAAPEDRNLDKPNLATNGVHPPTISPKVERIASSGAPEVDDVVLTREEELQVIYGCGCLPNLEAQIARLAEHERRLIVELHGGDESVLQMGDVLVVLPRLQERGRRVVLRGNAAHAARLTVCEQVVLHAEAARWGDGKQCGSCDRNCRG